MDTLVAVGTMPAEHRVAILNMASNTEPGGGFKRGAWTQEESLCRRTTLYPALAAARAGGKYPIPPTGLLFSADVSIVRGPEPECRWEEAPTRKVGVISCPAIRRPALNVHGHMEEPDKALTRVKVDLLLATAAANGYDALVLGALGCGAFYNPPSDVSRIFAEALRERGASFARVTFAVMGSDRNFATFKGVLTGAKN